MQTITTSRSGCHTEKNIRNWGVKSRRTLTPASLIEAFDPVRFSALHEGSRQVQALAPLPCGISARYQLDGPNLRLVNVRRVFTTIVATPILSGLHHQYARI